MNSTLWNPVSFLCLIAGFVGLGNASAVVIISDDFSTVGALNGTAPDVGPANWSANSLFTSNGSVLGAGADSFGRMAAIDLGADYFIDNPGVYELSLTVNLTSTADTRWWAIGFSDTTSTSINSGFHTDSLGSGNPWMLIRQNGQAVVFLDGTVTNLGNLTVATNTSPTITLSLDTTAVAWTLSAYVNSTPILLNGAETYTYATNPTIRYTGITANLNGSGATADDFILQSTIPEPSAVSLAVLAGVGALFLRRRRKGSPCVAS